MPVLLTALVLALCSPSLQGLVEETFSRLAIICAERLWELIAATVVVSISSVYIRDWYRGKADDEDDDDTKKQPAAPTTLSEALSGAAGLGFVASAYVLLFTEHRFRFSHGGRDGTPYLERLMSEVTPIQLLAMIVLSASFVVLIGCAGIALALEDTDMPRLSRLDAWSVVALFAQGLMAGWLVGVQAWYLFSGQLKLERQWSGLLWGLFFAGVGQAIVISYHFCRCQFGWFREGLEYIQPDRPPTKSKTFFQQMFHHLAQPSAFLLMGGYLSGTWKFSLMPDSYYQEDAPVDWFHVLLQLLVVDVYTVINHMAEHSLSSLYIASHKPHHRFISPTLFDAFDGSLTDTTLLILLPLFATCRTLTFVNTWSYIAFGFVYSTHFMLIHSEWPHYADKLASRLGIYTAKDHHVHHARFVHNYAHFFTFWDRALGTYRENI